MGRKINHIEIKLVMVNENLKSVLNYYIDKIITGNFNLFVFIYNFFNKFSKLINNIY